MKIIAGERKGHVLLAPKGNQTRPTLSRVRESLFSIIAPRLVDAVVLDLYAGAGALGLEALSRGAAHCTFVEKSQSALQALRANIAKLRYEEQSELANADVHNWIKRPKRCSKFDIIFSDPPYATEAAANTLTAIESHLDLTIHPIIVIQCGSREALPESTAALEKTRSERYGDTALHFYRRKQ